MQLLLAEEQACLRRRGMNTEAADFRSILGILLHGIIFGTCIQVDFILLNPWRSTGHTICLDADIADVAAEMSGKGGLGYETSKYDS